MTLRQTGAGARQALEKLGGSGNHRTDGIEVSSGLGKEGSEGSSNPIVLGMLRWKAWVRKKQKMKCFVPPLQEM